MVDSVREKDDVRAEAKKSRISVHFGQLMTIAPIKFDELAQHLQKMQGRIVYFGDCAKDENGVAAVYQALGGKPNISTRLKCLPRKRQLARHLRQCSRRRESICSNTAVF